MHEVVVEHRGWSNVLFPSEPELWGLRCDTKLCEELCEAVGSNERPIGSREFNALILSTMHSLHGCPMVRGLHLYADRFTDVGMFSGYVSGHLWIEKAIPELLRRFDAISNGVDRRLPASITFTAFP